MRSPVWIGAAALLLFVSVNVSRTAPPASAAVVNDGHGDYVYVAAGPFHMGDNFGDGEARERPVHVVDLDAFYNGKYEMTNREWRAFRDDPGYEDPKLWPGGRVVPKDQNSYWMNASQHGGGTPDSDPDGDSLSVSTITAPTVTETDAQLSVTSIILETAGTGEAARYQILTNTGTAHLAVFTNGDVKLWSTAGDPFQGHPRCPQRVVSDFTQQPCWYQGACTLEERSWRSCLEDISVEDVLEASIPFLVHGGTR